MVQIRDFVADDKEKFMELCREFYSGGAVLHAVDEQCFVNTFDELMNKTPFARGLMIEYEDKIAGYLLLSFTHSNEVGGTVVLLEELYILPEFQGKGIGKRVFDFVFSEYDNKTKRYRLEVNVENEGAIRLYKNLKFEQLSYDQYIIDRT